MYVQQVAFDIPAGIAKGLAAGDLTRYGGIVRNSAGQIVKHLKEVPISPAEEGALKQAVQKAMSLAKGKKEILIPVIVITGAFLIGGVIYSAVKGKEKKEAQRNAVKNFNARLTNYLNALRSESLTLDEVSNLQSAISELEAVLGGGDLTIEIPGEQFTALITAIVDYTSRLAEANDNTLNSDDISVEGNEKSGLKLLSNCLAVQRHIFENAA